ncbi:DNA polymerase IV [Aquicella siphonis]|uniref:DNA polymerase IV n=1 Tax=Aquicella siphonis TaxID=254247 RepID=A0A5E4PGG1_9COXI|nr:DNA polymerase IV [Aquicella siphonis]VVC75608.1 DNA polymerase IV [Aquicella siphonis]
MDIFLPRHEMTRKIIHIDMDCFYAAIEIRDNPSLADKPVAVGGPQNARGVICTSNYAARQYGVRSAMPVSRAVRLCKHLIILPVNMQKYKQVAQRLHQIFREYTHKVEPLALDEAYLDVTGSPYCKGSATLIAQAIRQKILDTEQLTASAGVAPNKLLAKIASGWKKPNGMFVIKPEQVESFIRTLPVAELFGVGKVTAEKLHRMGIQTCLDLQSLPVAVLTEKFGKLGQHLHDQCRGIDHRPVMADRERKSLSVEHTFPSDVKDKSVCLGALKVLYEKLCIRVRDNAPDGHIKNQFVKIKFSNFRQASVECGASELNFAQFEALFDSAFVKSDLPVRLLGLGVHLCDKDQMQFVQTTFPALSMPG